MATDDAIDTLTALSAIQQQRGELDRRERKLVRWARAVKPRQLWRTARAAAGLSDRIRPIRCHDSECSCSVVRNPDGTLDREYRQHTFTWAEIAGALGISRQAAQKRYRDVR